MRHAHAIDLRQEVPDEEPLAIDREAGVHRVARGAVGEPRRVGDEARAQRVLVGRDAVRERVDPVHPEKPRPVELALDPGRHPEPPSHRVRDRPPRDRARPRDQRAAARSQPIQEDVEALAIVPPEQLVRALSRERDRDPLAREPRHVPGRHRRRVPERAVEPRQDRLEVGGHPGAVQGQLVVLGLQERGGLPRRRELVGDPGVREPDRERPDRPGAGACHERDERPAVHTARQERPDRNVRDELPLRRRREQRAQPRDRLVVARAVARGLWRAPEAMHALAAGADLERRSGLDRAYPAQQRPARGEVLPGEEVPELDAVDVPHPREPAGQERADLGSERDATAVARDEQRLDPEPVAGEHERTAPRKPQREREHAVETREGVEPAVVEQPEGDLDVAAGAEAVAARELAPELAVVVDLAVEHDDGTVVLEPDRLRAGLEVDDREAAETERDVGVLVRPVVVGTAVDHRGRHARDAAAAVGAVALGVEDAADAAHRRSSVPETSTALALDTAARRPLA